MKPDSYCEQAILKSVKDWYFQGNYSVPMPVDALKLSVEKVCKPSKLNSTISALVKEGKLYKVTLSDEKTRKRVSYVSIPKTVLETAQIILKMAEKYHVGIDGPTRTEMLYEFGPCGVSGVTLDLAANMLDQKEIKVDGLAGSDKKYIRLSERQKERLRANLPV